MPSSLLVLLVESDMGGVEAFGRAPLPLPVPTVGSDRACILVMVVCLDKVLSSRRLHSPPPVLLELRVPPYLQSVTVHKSPRQYRCSDISGEIQKPNYGGKYSGSLILCLILYYCKALYVTFSGKIGVYCPSLTLFIVIETCFIMSL